MNPVKAGENVIVRFFFEMFFLRISQIAKPSSKKIVEITINSIIMGDFMDVGI